jgi:hypothetical protein
MGRSRWLRATPLCALVLGGGVSACVRGTPGCPVDIVANLTPRADDVVLGGVPVSSSLPAFFMPMATAGWSTALRDPGRAQPGVGFVAFQSFAQPVVEPTRLAIELPFPLAQGQTVVLSEGEPTGLTSDSAVEWLPADPSQAGASAALDACQVVKQSAVGPCAMAAGQSVMGTLEVVSVQPLQVHVAATFTTPNDPATSAALDADLNVVAMPEPCGGGIRID